jgi:hypothetical protein
MPVLREVPMAKYLVQANYMGEGLKGLLRNYLRTCRRRTA